MNKPIYETVKTYGGNNEAYTEKIIIGYERVTRPGFSRKKKPISMTKALRVSGKIHCKKQHLLNKNEFYRPKEWEYHRAKVIDEASGLVALVRH